MLLVFPQGNLVLSKRLTGRSIHHIVSASERFLISRVTVRKRLDRLKTRPRCTVNIEGIRVDDDAATFDLARNPSISSV